MASVALSSGEISPRARGLTTAETTELRFAVDGTLEKGLLPLQQQPSEIHSVLTFLTTAAQTPAARVLPEQTEETSIPPMTTRLNPNAMALTALGTTVDWFSRRKAAQDPADMPTFPNQLMGPPQPKPPRVTPIEVPLVGSENPALQAAAEPAVPQPAAVPPLATVRLAATQPVTGFAQPGPAAPHRASIPKALRQSDCFGGARSQNVSEWLQSLERYSKATIPTAGEADLLAITISHWTERHTLGTALSFFATTLRLPT